MRNLAQRRKSAEHMIEAISYLITVANRFEMSRVVTKLNHVRAELLLVISNDNNDRKASDHQNISDTQSSY